MLCCRYSLHLQIVVRLLARMLRCFPRPSTAYHTTRNITCPGPEQSLHHSNTMVYRSKMSKDVHILFSFLFYDFKYNLLSGRVGTCWNHFKVLSLPVSLVFACHALPGCSCVCSGRFMCFLACWSNRFIMIYECCWWVEQKPERSGV